MIVCGICSTISPKRTGAQGKDQFSDENMIHTSRFLLPVGPSSSRVPCFLMWVLFFLWCKKIFSAVLQNSEKPQASFLRALAVGPGIQQANPAASSSFVPQHTPAGLWWGTPTLLQSLLPQNGGKYQKYTKRVGNFSNPTENGQKPPWAKLQGGRIVWLHTRLPQCGDNER